jgi:hypothetical protein
MWKVQCETCLPPGKPHAGHRRCSGIAEFAVIASGQIYQFLHTLEKIGLEVMQDAEHIPPYTDDHGSQWRAAGGYQKDYSSEYPDWGNW